MELFGLPFMQRALLAAFLSGLLAPAVGVYIVQRRLSLLGDGLGHVAIAGVGLAFMTGWAPTPAAIALCVAGAVAIELLRQRGRASGDVGLAILFYGGLATGVLMAGIGGQGVGALSQYLFGSLTTVSVPDLVTIAVLSIVVIGLAVGLAPQLFAVCSDEDYARVQGLPVGLLNILIVVLAAVTVTLSMRTVGLLLVSAMMVVPVATAQNLVAGFRATLVLAMTLGCAVAVGGTVGSFYLNSASGATIVVTTIVLFLASWPIGALVARRSRSHTGTDADPGLVGRHHPAEPHANDHDHTDYVAIQHGEHVDYLHDGHRHAPHGDHYDEH